MTIAYTDYGDAETPDDSIRRMLLAMMAALPGWAPVEGSLDTALVEEFARESADIRYQAFIREPALAFAQWGVTVAGLAMVPGTAATIPVRIDLVDPGTTAPAGLVLVGTSSDGVEVTFTTADAVTAGPGVVFVDTLATATSTSGGDLGNGVPPGPLTLATATSAVLGVSATGPSTGGADPESADAYLDRLVASQATLHRGFVLAADGAILARSVPGVHRALGIDNYDATTGSTTAERTITFVPVDPSGTPVSAATKAALAAFLGSLREVNFVVRIADPTYTPIRVVYAAQALPGRSNATVAAAIRARVLAVLDPGAWAGGAEDPPVWRTGVRTVRYLDLVGELDRVDGVDYVSSLTLNGGTSDVVLTGVAALPASASAADPTTVSGTVSGGS